jgi:hypothetical protein
MALEREGTICRAVEINSVDDIADFWWQTDIRESRQSTRIWGLSRKPVGGLSMVWNRPSDKLRVPNPSRDSEPPAGHEQAKRVEWLPGPNGNPNVREANARREVR